MTTEVSLSVKRWLPCTPQQVVAAYTDPRQLSRWFGLATLSKWLLFEHDVRPGGTLRYGFITSEGWEIWGRCDFLAIGSLGPIEFVSSVTDEMGTVVAPRPENDWLLQIRTKIEVTPVADGVELTVSLFPHNAGENERALIFCMWPNMKARCEESLDNLAALIITQGSLRPH